MGRVVIVGAGVAGLSAGIWLADLGHEVTVLECRSRPGGQLDSGVPGPATLTLPAVLRDLFGKTGRRLDRELALRPAEPAIGYVTSAGQVTLPQASRGGTLGALHEVYGEAAAADWDRLMRRAADVWQTVRTIAAGHPVSWRSLAGLAARADSRRAVYGTATGLLTDARVGHPAIREIIAARAVLSGSDPSNAPAAVATAPYLEQTFGLWTVDGGPTAIVDALARRLRERGGVLATDTAATAYVVHSRRIAAVRTADDRVPADAVVSAVPDAAHRRLCGHPVGSRAGRTGAGGSRSIATLVLTGATRSAGPIRTVVAGTARDPVCVVEYPADGGAVIHVDVGSNLPFDDRFTDGVLAGLARRGFPIDPGPAAVTVRTPADWSDGLGLGPDSPYGPIRTAGWDFPRRARVTTPIDGLFRVGTATGLGPGIHSAAMSAAVAADLIGRPR